MASSMTVQLDEAALRALDRLAEKTRRSRDWRVGEAIHDDVSVNLWQMERADEGNSGC
jgi:predicted transcriptional regulator